MFHRGNGYILYVSTLVLCIRYINNSSYHYYKLDYGTLKRLCLALKALHTLRWL